MWFYLFIYLFFFLGCLRQSFIACFKQLFLFGSCCNVGVTEFGEAGQRPRSAVGTVKMIAMVITPEGWINVYIKKYACAQTHTGIHM